ncbi:MAG: site-2 protease family protein [Defluviitaleaceae bacterium]|nr:site-2 protease family protein [Defluviitaleaceae bacterium]MCL2836346.1 site-2 protease family protein [Defluviitaleaceae bacterium]
MRGFNPAELVYILPSVILVLTIHEFSHGFAAYLLGDKTAKYDGRLSFNPLRHIDWFGIVALIFFGFGWAKPVSVNPRNFKNPKVDFALTAAAGPVSNIIFAFLLLLIAVPLSLRVSYGGAGGYIVTFLLRCASLSLALGFFNMLPIPPLDGSKIFGAFLPDRIYFRYIGMGNIGMILLLVCLYMGVVSQVIGPLIQVTYSAMVEFLLRAFL